MDEGASSSSQWNNKEHSISALLRPLWLKRTFVFFFTSALTIRPGNFWWKNPTRDCNWMTTVMVSSGSCSMPCTWRDLPEPEALQTTPFLVGFNRNIPPLHTHTHVELPSRLFPDSWDKEPVLEPIINVCGCRCSLNGPCPNVAPRAVTSTREMNHHFPLSSSRLLALLWLLLCDYNGKKIIITIIRNNNSALRSALSRPTDVAIRRVSLSVVWFVRLCYHSLLSACNPIESFTRDCRLVWLHPPDRSS